MSPAQPSFTARMTGSLRRSGLRGPVVTVLLAGGQLRLFGAEGGERRVALDEILGMRVGLVRADNRAHPTLRVFLADGATLQLVPMEPPGEPTASRRSYPDFVRGLAQRLAGAGRLAGIEVGLGRPMVAGMTGLVGAFAAGAAGLAAWIWREPIDDPGLRWVFRGASAFLVLALVTVLAGFARSSWPRRVTALGDLDAVLPRP